VAPVAVRGREIRLEFDGLVAVGNGALRVAFVSQRAAPIGVRNGKFRVAADGLVVVGDGEIQLALRGMGDATAIVGNRVAGIEAYGLRVGGDGQVLLIPRGVHETLVERGAVGIELHGLREVGDGARVIFTAPVGYSAVGMRKSNARRAFVMPIYDARAARYASFGNAQFAVGPIISRGGAWQSSKRHQHCKGAQKKPHAIPPNALAASG